LKLAQDKNKKSETVLGYSTASNELYVMTTVDGKPPAITDKLIVKPADGKIRLQVLFDKSSLEVFVNGGEKVLTTLLFPDAAATTWSVFAKDGDVKVETLKAWDLNK
jgi:fructan beta-fructosidase